jgi:LPXTG-motif cell wall-anchored protein
MQNKNLYYVLGGVAVLGLVYFITKKKKQDIVVNLNPPMEVEEEVTTTTTTTTPLNSAVSILDKIKEIIQEVKNKNVGTPTTNP